MENGIYTGHIHGWSQFYKVEEGNIFFVEKGKWHKTVVTEERMSTFVKMVDPISEKEIEQYTIADRLLKMVNK